MPHWIVTFVREKIPDHLLCEGIITVACWGVQGVHRRWIGRRREIRGTHWGRSTYVYPHAHVPVGRTLVVPAGAETHVLSRVLNVCGNLEIRAGGSLVL
jgi:hypothetical protein